MKDISEKINRLKKISTDLAKFIESDCPKSGEKVLAMTSLEQAVIWAATAIKNWDQNTIGEENEHRK